uniref:Uncharacterized protein n=1 Tax=Arundo donax TaxID=35708 RepID=A0A0A8Y042_ARUDO
MEVAGNKSRISVLGLGEILECKANFR